jgi:hypothetical protein
MMTPITAKAVTTSCQVVFVGAWRIMRVPPVRGHTASGVRLPRDPRPPMLPHHLHPTDVPSRAPGGVVFAGFGLSGDRVWALPTPGTLPCRARPMPVSGHPRRHGSGLQGQDVGRRVRRRGQWSPKEPPPYVVEPRHMVGVAGGWGRTPLPGNVRRGA